MSGGVDSIKSALEGHLDAMTPAIATAWENEQFTPPGPSTPYQRAFHLIAQPANPEFGSGSQQSGIFQVSLFYPLGDGGAAADARAILISTQFPRGLSLVNGGVTVSVNRTTHIGQGTPDGDRWMVPVRVFWYANML